MVSESTEFPDTRAQYCLEHSTNLKELRAKEKDNRNRLRDKRPTLTKAERVEMEKNREKPLLSKKNYKTIISWNRIGKSTKRLREGIPGNLLPPGLDYTIEDNNSRELEDSYSDFD